MNKYTETIKTALDALRSNKIRSFLTMLGVIIGVFAVITLVSIGSGIQKFITSQFDALGSNLVLVAPGQVDFADDPAKYFSKNQLNDEHIELIEENASEFVEYVTPSVRVGQTIRYKTNDYFSTVIGANEVSNRIINYEVGEGRALSRGDVKTSNKVVLIGSLVQEDLFPTENPLGKRIKIGGESFEVIGVLKKKDATYDDAVIAPYTTVMETFDIEFFSSMAIKIKDSDEIDLAIRSIEFALLRDLDEDDFSVFSSTEILESITNILRILTIGIGAIAGISLLVGGIGIMNIMLVSVTERTREIGLRKSVGATPIIIAQQFMFEAIFLSAVGGIVGIILGWVLAIVAGQFIETSVSVGSILIAFGFSLGVGVIFGTYPAVQASKKDPIEALRFE